MSTLYKYHTTDSYPGSSTDEWTWICGYVVDAVNNNQPITVYRQDEPKPFIVVRPNEPVSLSVLATIATGNAYVADVSHLNRLDAEAEYESALVDIMFTAAAI